MSHSSDPDVKPEEWKVFTICYNVESTNTQVDTYRYQLQNLEKLTCGKPQAVMCNQTDFKTVPLRYLCGTLYMNFRLLWDPITKILASYSGGMDTLIFWNIFGEQLKNVNNYIRNPIKDEQYGFKSNCSFLAQLLEDSQKIISKPDFINYRILLWKCLAHFSDIAEAKTRDVAEVFLDFIE